MLHATGRDSSSVTAQGADLATKMTVVCYFYWNGALNLEPAALSSSSVKRSMSWLTRTPLLMSTEWFLWVKTCHEQCCTNSLQACTSSPSLGAELSNTRIAQAQFAGEDICQRGIGFSQTSRRSNWKTCVDLCWGHCRQSPNNVLLAPQKHSKSSQ